MAEIDKGLPNVKRPDDEVAEVVNLEEPQTPQGPVEVTEDEDMLVVNGKGPHSIKGGSTINASNDHRIAMTFEILKLIKTGSIGKIEEELPIIKTSFPEFYQIIRSLHASF